MQPGSGMKFATLHRVSPAGLTEKMSCEERRKGERSKAEACGGAFQRGWGGVCVAGCPECGKSREKVGVLPAENSLRSFIQGLGDHCN